MHGQVRPYLIADGGDVSVAAVEGGTVMLRLEGACGTCPSSTATMKMGIERALKVCRPGFAAHAVAACRTPSPLTPHSAFHDTRT